MIKNSPTNPFRKGSPTDDIVVITKIVAYIGKRLGVDFEYVDGNDWQSREAALYRGDIQVGWICGLPYIVEADKQQTPIELLAAPVMAGGRYKQKTSLFLRCDS